MRARQRTYIGPWPRIPLAMRCETRYLMAIMPGQVDRQTRKEALERELGEEVTCDGLTRDFVMFQRRRGHRHSTDDLLTAWYAVACFPAASSEEPLRLLDLGSGIGSIGLAVLWAALQQAPDTRLTAIEAQELSARLLRENVDANDVSRETRVIHGDLRDASLLADGTTFDLITGSPPYFDVKNGIVSADSQRAHARFELRGDVRPSGREVAFASWSVRPVLPDGAEAARARRRNGRGLAPAKRARRRSQRRDGCAFLPLRVRPRQRRERYRTVVRP